MTKTITEKLTREMAFKNNIDPMGNKWGIGKVIGTSLFHVAVVEGNKQTKPPQELEGKFTSATLAQKHIETFLDKMWRKSDETAEKLARKDYRDKVEGADKEAA